MENQNVKYDKFIQLYSNTEIGTKFIEIHQNSSKSRELKEFRVSVPKMSAKKMGVVIRGKNEEEK